MIRPGDRTPACAGEQGSRGSGVGACLIVNSRASHQRPTATGVLPKVAKQSGATVGIDSLSTEEPEIGASCPSGGTPAAAREATDGRDVLVLGDWKLAHHGSLQQLPLTLIAASQRAFPKVIEEARRRVGGGSAREFKAYSTKQPKIAGRVGPGST